MDTPDEIRLCDQAEQETPQGDVRLCDPAPEEGQGDIVLCDDQIDCDKAEPFRVIEVGGKHYLAGGVPPYLFLGTNTGCAGSVVRVWSPSEPLDEGPAPCPTQLYFMDACHTCLIYAVPDNYPGGLTLTGPDAPAVGNNYAASGGAAPYVYSISCGSIEPDTGVVTDLSGCCGSGAVKVTDSCLFSATISVRFPAGTWVLQHTDCAPYSDDGNGGCVEPWLGCGTNIAATCITGGSKEVHHWKHAVGCLNDYCQLISGDNWLGKQCSGQLPCRTVDISRCHCLWKIDYYSWECP